VGLSFSRLIVRSAAHYWRTNLAVTLGVAAAVSVLGGALVVGDSVRGSLRDLAVSRIGRTTHAIASPGYFREALAQELAAGGAVAAAPLISTQGFVTHEPSGRRASAVLIYGVDDRFWRFHGLEPREGVLVSPALGAELQTADGDVLLTRLQRPSEIPLESLFAHKEDIGRTIRLNVAGTLAAAELGEFSLQPQQTEVRAVFAPLRRLQRDLGAAGRINAVLLAGSDDESVERAYRAAVALEDLGLKVEAAGDGSTVLVETASGILGESLERSLRDAGQALGLGAVPIFTYLANTIRIGDREIPYSLVTGLPLNLVLNRTGRDGSARSNEVPSASPQQRPELGARLQHAPNPDAIVLNEWAARELDARAGDTARIEYYLWDPAAGLRTASADFVVSAIVPLAGLAADRRLAPEYPGITGAESLADWDPPFPLDLSRVRKQDEQYWDDYRSTPKAFIHYEHARALWATRYGQVTGMRLPIADGRNAARLAEALRGELRRTVSPASQGLTLTPVRSAALAAATGATNFGEYFSYFSFFIVVSALMLGVLFFRLGIEGRLRQMGLLRATGYTAAHLRRLLVSEAALLAITGSAVGVAGAIAYAHLIVHGLRTWWVGAVGTTLLDVHVRPVSLIAGAAGGIVAALLCVLWSLRGVARRSPRALLSAYSLEPSPGSGGYRGRRGGRFTSMAALLGMALMTLGFVSPATQAGAFFGAGAALLIACLLFLSSWLRARDARTVAGRGPWAVSRLGFRSAAFRPGRSVLSAALIASAAFIIVSVDAFRRGPTEMTSDPRSGTGGFALLAESEVPLVHNPNDSAGREALMIRAPELSSVRFSRFRFRPGEDASCLNLYRPGNPAIIAPEARFIQDNRFTFARSLAETGAEHANPWLLLERAFDDGAVPVIADATSMQYVLHVGLGDTMSIDLGGERPVILRFVGALKDSVLQGELIVGERHFVSLFPGHEGFRFFLIDAPSATSPAQAAALAAIVERELDVFGVDAVTTADRLNAFHRVENTYLSTFQALGGLGLLLGTVGLATVMFRNVLERRRELALLRAVGYNARHVTMMILAETALLLGAGLLAGTGCAAIAVAPAWLDRGSAPGVGLALLLAGVVVAGLASAVVATRAALTGQLLEALRAE
jgi:ABC-type lipoprotein release transport system permease subunit